MKQQWILIVCLTVCACNGGEAVIYRSNFADGAKDWDKVNQAAVSDVARRRGGKSLLVKQYKNEEADSAWLSPVFENPGKPVRISVWAADNYRNTKDHSFSAAFELVACDADGKVTSPGGDWTYIPWDSERYISQFVHTRTVEGLIWKHYSAVKMPKGEHYRLRFCWPKSRMQGECYFTDVKLTVAQKTKAAAEKKAETTATPYRLEISTAQVANLFYVDDPFRFEFLLYEPSGKPIAKLNQPIIHYVVTDYEHFQVASGTVPFNEAKTIKVGKRSRRPDRSKNLHVSRLLPEGTAKEVGRHFYLEAKLMDGDQFLANDTITYGVVNPRQTQPDEIKKSRYISFAEGGGFRNKESKHDEQTLVAKMGQSLTHTWDYNGWRKAQPKKDGPITIKKGPASPKLVYCPNLEQIRGRKPNHPWGDMSRNAPDWAIIDDPFHEGCRGFQIDGYVKYIVEYVKTNRHRIVQVVPSGLERTIDARTLELQRKAYASIKKECPEIPVGMMVWGVLSKSGVDLILKEKLYEVADFFDTHVYLSAVDWTEWERLRKILKRKGIQRRLISTEFARVGGTDQLQRARDVITSNLDAHAHDMYRITNFLMYVGNNRPIKNTVLRGDYPGDGFQWMQYVDRPRVSPMIEGKSWRNGLYGKDFRGSSLMPMLHAMSFYNLVQNTECADFKLMFQPTDRSVAYVYARDGKTICYLYLREPAPPTTLALMSNTPYTMQDLYARSDKVTPAGASLVVATMDPLALVFDKEVPELYKAKTAKEVLKLVEGGLAVTTVARGATTQAKVVLPPVFRRSFKATVKATVDGTWPQTKAQTVAVNIDKPAATTLPITVAADRPAGSYTFATRIYDGGKLVTVLKQPLVVSEVLSISMAGVPMTKTQDPAIAVTITSLADQPMAGTVTVANRYFGTDYEPALLQKPYSVGPKGRTEVRFELPREQVGLAGSYVMQATLADKTGFTIKATDDISFQPCVKTQKPIKVDADLTDWDLDELLPIPFDRWMRGPRKPEEFSAKFYSRWDDEKLYFAMVVTDSVPVLTGGDKVSWNDDNIMLCLYPWRWHMGEPLNTGYYREHLGPIQNGGAGFMRVGYVPSGPSTPAGNEIAVKRTDNGWIYEWAYPKEQLYPLELKTGGGFRLSLSLWDQHQVPKKGWGKFTWLTFSGFNTSVNAQPDKWRQFTLTN